MKLRILAAFAIFFFLGLTSYVVVKYLLSDNTSAKSLNLSAKNVSLHNNPSDCWVIIEGKVYNVTDYLADHPGGEDQIIPYCGKDATDAFKTRGGRKENHSNSAKLILENYLIGPVK